MLGHFAAEAKKRLSARIADQQCLAAGVCDLVYARIGVKSRHGTFADFGPRGADGQARDAHGRRSATAVPSQQASPDALSSRMTNSSVDRKSVVSGKSGSERVDHGGRGLIKKKKKTKK